MTSFHVEQKLNKVIESATADILQLNHKFDIYEAEVAKVAKQQKRNNQKIIVLGLLVLLSFIF
jgi:Asp/Glu/hydantoin racemase